ncbi:cell division protein FtsL [Taklimakanibacter lacteus]|uniref:cell division protein FtsL n=1 Tax=Taklimakanibacter lacteus TaxID=2268456 RepID=UPI000E671BD7
MWIRTFNACLVLAVLCAAYVLYSLEHSIRGVERQIARSQGAIANEKETIGLLGAEWSSLIRPERLQRLAEQHLTLKRISPDQFVRIDELAARVPAEPPVKLEEAGKDAIGDILKAME